MEPGDYTAHPGTFRPGVYDPSYIPPDYRNRNDALARAKWAVPRQAAQPPQVAPAAPRQPVRTRMRRRWWQRWRGNDVIESGFDETVDQWF
jgi:hypothetical protein